jgi:hypothetical protein
MRQLPLALCGSPRVTAQPGPSHPSEISIAVVQAAYSSISAGTITSEATPIDHHSSQLRFDCETLPRSGWSRPDPPFRVSAQPSQARLGNGPVARRLRRALWRRIGRDENAISPLFLAARHSQPTSSTLLGTSPTQHLRPLLVGRMTVFELAPTDSDSKVLGCQLSALAARPVPRRPSFEAPGSRAPDPRDEVRRSHERS